MASLGKMSKTKKLTIEVQISQSASLAGISGNHDTIDFLHAA